jgi:hypothetical protein
VVAIDDPALLRRKIYVGVKSFGYEFAADGFGSRGVTLETKPGEVAKLKIKRLNIAERLYRVTGEGIYADSVRLGRKPPIKQPLVNAEVTGQDSIQSIVYNGKIRLFWGDTAKQSYPLGLFKMAGAVADLPDKGGLNPSVGVDLKYFTRLSDGFAREMAPLPVKGLVWIDGIMTLADDSGRERMIAHASNMESLAKRLGRYLIIYNDSKDAFETLKQIDNDALLSPAGHPFRVTNSEGDYFYFPTPYPCVRVRATWDAVTDVTQYEAYTPLKPGSRYDKKNPQLERDAGGKLVVAWKKNTAAVTPAELKELADAKLVKREELPFRLQDADTGKPIRLHGSSVYYNDYRKRWIMIGVETMGASMLGEIWYAEAGQPEGPWVDARKIITHDRVAAAGLGERHEGMDFYNPKQHPFFDQQGGRIIYFEGTYTNMFAGNPVQTPRYEYNQVMYRLDLADPRLKLPAAPAAAPAAAEK